VVPDRHRASRQQQRIDGGDSIGTAGLRRDLNGKEHESGPSKKSELAPAARDQREQAHHPDWRGDRIHEEDLRNDRGQRRSRHVLQGLRIAVELERGPAIRHLPEQVRQNQHRRGRAADHEPAGGQQPPRGRRQHPDSECGHVDD